MRHLYPDRPAGILLLTTLSGILYAVSFPKPSLWPLAFMCLVPFFVVLYVSDTLKDQFLAGTVFGAVTALSMGYWLYRTLTVSYETSVITALLFMIFGLVLPLALLFTLFSLAYGFLKRDSILFHALMVPSLWILIEYLKEIVPGSIPWAHIGYALFPWTSWIQGADIWGIYGVSFLVITVNSLMVPIVIGIFKKRWSSFSEIIFKNLIPPIVIGAVIILPAIYGIIRISSINEQIKSSRQTGKEIPITIVQGDFDSRERWKGSGFYNRIQVYTGLSDFDEYGESLYIWPETVLNATGKVNAELFGYILSSLGRKNVLIAGGVRGEAGGVRNSAFIFSRDRGVRWYDKNILLPHAETVLFAPLLGRYYSAPAEFVKGDTPSTVRTVRGAPSLSICFELLYPLYVRKGVSAGADLLVNLSNDAWFGDSPQPYLHLQSAAFRCVENRRFMARASNSGISAVIHPAGRLVEQTGLNSRVRLEGEVVLMNGTTIYTRFGDWILYLASLVFFAGLVYVIIRD